MTAFSEARVSIPSRRCCASANRWLSVSCSTQTESENTAASDKGIRPSPEHLPAMMAIDDQTIQRLTHKSRQNVPNLLPTSPSALSDPAPVSDCSARGADNNPAIHRENG